MEKLMINGWTNECCCIKCTDARIPGFPGRLTYPFRYACEICGNKRCPHHSNHTLSCTGSNEPGQKGSVYE